MVPGKVQSPVPHMEGHPNEEQSIPRYRCQPHWPGPAAARAQPGVLVLRGCLPSYYLKQIAQEIVAHQTQGVDRLDNQIQVVRPASR
jgi:hypothetical protein